jgi:hypothetical protein
VQCAALCRQVGGAGAGLLSSCCVPQVLQFGLYEFIREEGNPGGVRKMKKGTEVWSAVLSVVCYAWYTTV